jgi:hypothetical protein
LPTLITETNTITCRNIIPSKSGLVSLLTCQTLQIGGPSIGGGIDTGINKTNSTVGRETRNRTGWGIVEFEGGWIMTLVIEITSGSRGSL